MADGLLLDGLTVQRGGRRIVDGLDLVVEPGRILAVRGAAGTGKSTLLTTLAGLRAPEKGRVLLHGTPVDPVRAGTVQQEHVLIGGLTAAENVATRILARRRLRDHDWPLVLSLLERLGLPEASWHNLLEQLSGGQQQRVAVARALIDEPELVLCDDPTSELDERSAALVRAELRAAADRGAVVVIAAPDGASALRADVTMAL